MDIRVGTSGFSYPQWLGRFYPELSDCMLLCATEMSRRADMDAVGQTLAQPASQQQEAEVLA